jgi:hypothetical protein
MFDAQGPVGAMKPDFLFLALALTVNSYGAELDKSLLMQRAVLIEQDLGKVRSLVASGVDLNAPIGCGTFSPLDGAVNRENPEMVALLISLGARPIDTQIVAAAFSASHEAGLKMVKALHAAGASINARKYYSGTEGGFSTPIHQAVWRENAGLAAYLLGQEGIQLDLPSVDGYTPLMIAVEKGSDEIFEMLLAAGADPRAKSRQGMDAAAVAERVIAKQQSFLKTLDAHSNRP